MLVEILETVSRWAIPALLLTIPVYACFRGVPVYETFVEGAEEGFQTAVRIIPYLVGMFVAIGIFRASGAMALVSGMMQPLMSGLGVPAEVLPMAVMRPLSGSAALGLATELINHYGPDSFIGRLASTMQGSTDTTFFILTIYFGSVGVRQVRYALTVGLLADVTSLIASVYICNQLFR